MQLMSGLSGEPLQTRQEYVKALKLVDLPASILRSSASTVWSLHASSSSSLLATELTLHRAPRNGAATALLQEA